MLDKQYIEDIIKEGESETLEFKLNFGAETLICINAFANHKGGIVIIGISDSGEIIGVDINIETLQKWQNEIKQKIARCTNKHSTNKSY